MHTEDENNVLESSRHATSRNTNIGDAATTIRQPQRSISPKDRAATLENDERSDADTYEVDVDDDFRSEDFDLENDERSDADRYEDSTIADSLE